jgi:hypothetical protein
MNAKDDFHHHIASSRVQPYTGNQHRDALQMTGFAQSPRRAANGPEKRELMTFSRRSRCG